MGIEPGKNVGHYKIVSKIGAGGMGEVYLAQDTKLDRKVAIKFLHEELSKDADKLSRFVQEARAASALNHPNILTVHEIGEADGNHYIATELIDGGTLRAHLASKDSMSLNAILKIGVQVAEAMSAAHQAGIIHRDIKPENIMIRNDGYAKVLDFGLAKLSERRGAGETGGHGNAGTRGHGDGGTRGRGDGETGSDGEGNTLIAASPRPRVPASPRPPIPASVNTTPGMVMGTVSYMSPEQARGNPTDARTDIWSLGVVLYEMLAGKVPFSGETINHTIVSILEREPLLLENVPAELQRIVRKAMTKDVEMRYQSARDLLIDLKNLRRELDIQGELERSVIPNRETQAQTSGESETQFFTGSGKRTASGQMAATQSVTTSSSSLEYAVTQAKSHKLVTAVIGVVLIAVIASIGYFAVLSRGGSGQINSIAVLPFENRSGTPDSEYLSDGLSDSLIYRLTQLPNLKVSPTSSVLRYKGKQTDVAEIARELDVDAVMSGKLAQRGDDLTISVELIDTRTKKLIWAEQYDRKMADLLATQREIATTITQKLELKLSGSEKGITKKYTDSNEAYQLYLKGRYHFARRTKDDINKAIDSHEQAIKLDPNFAIAYARIAEAYNQMSNYPYLSPKEAFPKAKAAALRALEIDATLAEAHAALGNTLTSFDWDWTAADQSFKRALELDPNSATTHYRYATEYLISVGRTEEGVAEVKRALEIEPLDPNMVANLARVHLYNGQREVGLEHARKSYEIDPTFTISKLVLGMALNANGRYAEAIEHAESLLQGDPNSQHMLQIAGFAYAKTGRKKDAEAVVERLRAIERTQYVIPSFLATIYGAMGERDKAFAEMEKAIEKRDSWLKWIRAEPIFDPLRDDPRFAELIKRMKLPA